MRFLRSSKCLNTPLNSPKQHFESAQKLATETAAPHLPNSCTVTIANHYYGAVIEGL